MKGPKRKKQKPIAVIHNAPGKKGKLEYRFFKTNEEAVEYIIRNESPREHGRPGRIAKIRGAK